MTKIIDEALNEPATEAPPAPEDFSLGDWLLGVGPATAVYPFAGREIPLQARTTDWSAQLLESMKNESGLEQDLAWLAGHVTDESITVDHLRHLHSVAPGDYKALVELCQALDLKPRATISPRFLPAASD